MIENQPQPLTDSKKSIMLRYVISTMVCVVLSTATLVFIVDVNYILSLLFFGIIFASLCGYFCTIRCPDCNKKVVQWKDENIPMEAWRTSCYYCGKRFR
jgi:hypothetical protein